MKKIISVCLLASLMAMPAACANMSKTSQGALSGAAGGALVGAGIGKLSGGHGGSGALIGGALGGVIGAIYGAQEERRSEGYHSDGYRQ
jgi:outer membrane lipoprotein SlyB